MTEAKFKVGDKVSWIKPMACVPHPEGKTDRNGVVLPVFRDKLEKGRVMSYNYHGYSVRPDWAEEYKQHQSPDHSAVLHKNHKLS